jgi:tRNA/rRNA methyltransferase
MNDVPPAPGPVAADPAAATDTASAFAALGARVRIVLARPSHPGNIGAAARALRAMGFARLLVVAPRDPDFRSAPEALALATHGADVLAAAEVHATLDGALAGVRYSYAMTGYTREFGPPLVDMRGAAQQSLADLQADRDGDVAFVFGSERDGLLNDEVERCGRCCAIPAAPAADSLNLAQAVQIAVYELRLALAGGSRIEAALQRFADDAPAEHVALEGLYAHVEQALRVLGYLDPAAPKRLMSRLRRLGARAKLSAAEVDILRGIAAAAIAPRRTRAGRKGGGG